MILEGEMLRRVQLVQLEILKEIKRVCDKNSIKYFLTAGTLLGAVRHKGFIPWDDDLDVGMLKEDYDKFCEIAPKELDEKYYFQNWHNDKTFSLEIGKVRKKNTVYVEAKSNNPNVGIFVDVIVYSNAPENVTEREKSWAKMLNIHRMLIGLSGCNPWIENGKTDIKKRIGYFFYTLVGRIIGRKKLIEKFEKIRNNKPSGILFHMVEGSKLGLMKREWYDNTIELPFEDGKFPCPIGYDGYLCNAYGDYMTPPPEEKRKNRHQILNVKL